MNSFHAVLKYHSRNNCFGYVETFTDIQHTPTIQVSFQLFLLPEDCTAAGIKTIKEDSMCESFLMRENVAS